MRDSATEPTVADKQLSMIRSGAAVMSGKGLAMALGFAYWVLAANLYDEATVGIVAAAISAVMLIGQLSVLGLETSLVLMYPGRERSRALLFDSSFTIVIGASIVTSALLVAIVTAIQGNLADVSSDPLLLTLFMAMGSVAGAMTIQDQVSIAIKRGDHVIPRNTLNGLVSIIPLAGLLLSREGAGGASVLFGAWVLGSFSGVVLGISQMRRLADPYHPRLRVDRSVAPLLIRIGLPNHLLTLTERLPVFVTPLIVTELISPEANAYWYVVWMAAWVTLVGGRSLAAALLAEASQDRPSLASHVEQALKGMLGFGGIGAIATIVLAPYVLGILGDSYAEAGTLPLRILVLSFAPYAMLMTYYGVCRITKRLVEANLFGGALSVTLIVSAVIATSHGLPWVAGSWLGVTSAFGLVAWLRLRNVVAAEGASS